MARSVECGSCSDDELPHLDELLGRKPVAGQARKLWPSTTTSPTKKSSTSASSPSKRRVRRLGSGNHDAANPLFRPWNAGNEDATEVAGRISLKGASSERRPLSEEQVGDKQSENSQPKVPSTDARRSRRPRIHMRLDHDSTEETSQSNRISTARPRAMRNRRPSNSKAAKESTCDASEDDAMEHVKENIQATDSKRIQPRRSNLNHGPKHGIASDEDEPSIYQTAAEESSEYNESCQSESDAQVHSGAILDKSLAAKLLFTSPRKAPPHDSAPMPRGVNPKRREASRDTKLSSAKPTATSLRGTDQEQLPKCSNDASNTLNLTDTFSKLQLDFQYSSDEEVKPTSADAFAIPPLTPPKKNRQKSLMSPRKQARIPDTPHEPSVDNFWCQEFVDDWNDQHSPRKPSRSHVPTEGPVKSNAKKETKKKTKENKENKKSFEARKHQLAEDFLGQLDARITNGKIAKLAESTGGVKIVWTKTLNTTAGRANWKRETIRTRQAGAANAQETVIYKHHASIELAEKVIDDEHRLLNVLAHEFCHLANFMVNGITNNPHGKEFKVWAAKCSEAFGAQGIEVTTKHTYEIDFKYIWACTACGSEYKRHSKSIDPQRHRCGGCKGLLKQTKPVPRGGGAGGKPSEYQVFMKEQMKIVRSENPGSPQKEVMRIIADKWAKRDRSKEAVDKAKVNSVVERLVDLTLKE